METENSASGSGSPEISMTYCKGSGRKIEVSQVPDFGAILAEYEAGTPPRIFLLDDSKTGSAQENRYVHASGSLESVFGFEATATILTSDDKRGLMSNIPLRHQYERSERSVEGCTSFWTINTRQDGLCTTQVRHTCTRNERSEEGCTSFCIFTVWQHGRINFGRNEKSGEGCTSFRLHNEHKRHAYAENGGNTNETEVGTDVYDSVTPNTFRFILMIQSVGYHYFVCLQLLGYVIAKLCFLHFGMNYADVGTRLADCTRNLMVIDCLFVHCCITADQTEATTDCTTEETQHWRTHIERLQLQGSDMGMSDPQHTRHCGSTRTRLARTWESHPHRHAS